MNFEWHKFVKFKNYLSLTGSKLTNDFVATHWQKFFYQYPNSIVKKFSICRKRHQMPNFFKVVGPNYGNSRIIIYVPMPTTSEIILAKIQSCQIDGLMSKLKIIIKFLSLTSQCYQNLREVEKWLIKRDTVPFLVKFLFRFRSLSVMLDMIPMLAKVY